MSEESNPPPMSPARSEPPSDTRSDRISVTFQRVAEDHFVAVEEIVPGAGEGETIAEALDDLLDGLREYRDALQESDPLVLFSDQKHHLAHLVALDIL